MEKRKYKKVYFKTCPICGNGFYGRVDKICCSVKCISRYKYLNRKNNPVESEVFRESKRPKWFYLEVNNFVYRIKRQNYMADVSDIFVLIDYYDKIFIRRDIPAGEPEIKFSKMFLYIARWVVKNKELYLKK